MIERVELRLTVREAEAVHRIIEAGLAAATEGKNGVHRGDKRKAREVQDQLFQEITMSDEWNSG